MKTTDLKPGSILRHLGSYQDWWLVLNVTKYDHDKKDAVYIDFLSYNGIIWQKQAIMLNEPWDEKRHTIL